MNTKILSIIISIIALIFSVFSYNRTLNLSAANLIFPQEGIIVEYVKNPEMNIIGDIFIFTPTIKNIGESSASNVELKVYTMLANKEYNFIGHNAGLVKMFDDKLVHALQPGSITTFGNIQVGRTLKLSSSEAVIDLVKSSESIILLYTLEYYDKLLEAKKLQCYIYSYNFGNNKIQTLLDSDYQTLTNSFEDYFSKSTDSICPDFAITN